MIVTSGEKTTTKTYENVEAGSYPGRCIRIVDLGTHVSDKYKDDNGEWIVRREVSIVWELSELRQDGRPFVVSWDGTLSLNPKSNLNKLLTNWRGRDFTAEELAGFELLNVLDKCCLINVSKDASKKNPDSFFNNVKSVMPLPKGMSCDERVNDLFTYELPQDINSDKHAKLWPKEKKLVESSKEFEKYHQAQPSDLPF